MIPRRVSAFFVPLIVLPLPELRAQAAPTLVALFPMGGQRGTVVDVEVRGAGLAGTNAVWLGEGTKLDSLSSSAHANCTRSPDGLAAHVKAVADDARAKVQLVIDPKARVGFHTLALVSSGGLSASLSFWVSPHAVIQETAAAHNTPESAQPVKLPIAVNGRLCKSGQLNYYGFAIAREQAVAFEVVALHGAGFDPQLALYETGGSFLDPTRSRRLLFREEITQGSMPASRRMTHDFIKPARYVVNVGNLFAQGSGDFSYLLRIAPEEPKPHADSAGAWAQRRLQELRSRTVAGEAMAVELMQEAAPNGKPDQTRLLKIPAVVEGTIGRPGDIDRYRFMAQAGQKLAFEVQTPRAAPPQFNLRLDVVDAKGAVVLSNLQVREGKIGTEAAKVIQIAPQLMGQLDQEGEYSLRVRDLTSIHGSPDHVYRVLVRPQVPHVGEGRIQPAGPVNLVPGGRQRLMVNTPSKEGYTGTLAIAVEGLPQGVKAFVGANNTIELVADTSAPFTPLPQVVRISGLPVVGEKSGSGFLMSAIPVMIVKK